ncbi:hypothetical protein AVEN_22972-1 [Araneus ventricosus]|uniref:Uncharacterized protein n=1 Tax=Araneus ventricosus TaxID=182803 RepID=A0A4Y2RP71_ARAVE|nr:hypothetical protein AVEN_22972-1 [Araneus ventricosus]
MQSSGYLQSAKTLKYEALGFFISGKVRDRFGMAARIGNAPLRSTKSVQSNGSAKMATVQQKASLWFHESKSIVTVQRIIRLESIEIVSFQIDSRCAAGFLRWKETAMRQTVEKCSQSLVSSYPHWSVGLRTRETSRVPKRAEFPAFAMRLMSF